MAAPLDPLAPFRAPGAKPVAAPPALRAGYQAFTKASGASKPARLEIRPKDGLAVARLYSSLTEIAYDRSDYTGILLMMPGKVIKLRGKRLRPIVEALLAGTCESITELRDGEACEDAGPVVERIELVMPQAEQAKATGSAKPAK